LPIQPDRCSGLWLFLYPSDMVTGYRNLSVNIISMIQSTSKIGIFGKIIFKFLNVWYITLIIFILYSKKHLHISIDAAPFYTFYSKGPGAFPGLAKQLAPFTWCPSQNQRDSDGGFNLPGKGGRRHAFYLSFFCNKKNHPVEHPGLLGAFSRIAVTRKAAKSRTPAHPEQRCAAPGNHIPKVQGHLS
jgi:hypothetical protein